MTINGVLSTVPDGVRMAGCVQLDRRNVYLTYWALGEVRLGGPADPVTGERRLPPDEVLSEFGMCVKVWNYEQPYASVRDEDRDGGGDENAVLLGD